MNTLKKIHAVLLASVLLLLAGVTPIASAKTILNIAR